MHINTLQYKTQFPKLHEYGDRSVVNISMWAVAVGAVCEAATLTAVELSGGNRQHVNRLEGRNRASKEDHLI